MFITEGTLIDGRYEVVGTIGAGGMGVVYEAHHRSLERIVAVKMLTAGSGVDDEDRVRFEREALILSRLSHPNIVQFYAYGVWSNVPYIVIERVNGQSLQQLLSKNQPLELRVALNIARQVCEGLQHVHGNDVLHRDLKPTNILVVDSPGQRRQVKLIDFGLAKLLGRTKFLKLTQAGMALGSVMYMSPEQCLGESVDARSDIYSLGCLLYQMLTGHPPYTADNATAVMFQQVNDSVGSTEYWSKVPPELQPVLSKCMAKEIEQRYSSAASVDEDLGKILSGLSAELEGVTVCADAKLRRSPNPFISVDSWKTPVTLKHFTLVAVALLALNLTVAGIFLPLRNAALEPVKPLASSLREQLFRLTHTAWQIDETKANRLCSLIASYKRDRFYAVDRSDLVLLAYIQAIGFHYRKRDFAKVRQYCKDALEDCRGLDADHGGSYPKLVKMYHDACVPVHCQLSLVPLLEDTLKRFPNSDRTVRYNLGLLLVGDYLELERFNDARFAANQASLLEPESSSKEILLAAYQPAVEGFYWKQDFVKVRQYGKQALKDCRGIDAAHSGAYLSILGLCHNACTLGHSQLSLLPLLQEASERYKNGDRRLLCNLYLSMGSDYLLMEQFGAARRAAQKAGSLAINEEQKNQCKPILRACDRAHEYQVCKDALESYRVTNVDNGEAYLHLLQKYYDTCVPLDRHLSLIPLLQDSLKRYPRSDRASRFGVQLKLATNYLLVGQFTAARQGAKRAEALAIDEEHKNAAKTLLEKCNSEKMKSSLR